MDLLPRVQARFLKELFHASKGGFVLKGGVALSMLYGPSRLTRDVDLDFPPAPIRTAERLHNQVMKALQHALRGTKITDIRINEPGKGEISPKWRVSGLGPDRHEFRMKVEVSRRPPPPGSVRQATVSGVATFGLGTYYVDLYDERTLVAMKLSALLGRTAVRDVCDLDLLLPTHLPSPALVDWAIQHAGVSAADAPTLLTAQLTSMDWTLFQTQMIADENLMSKTSSDTWEDMKARVGSTLTEVLLSHRQHQDVP